MRSLSKSDLPLTVNGWVVVLSTPMPSSNPTFLAICTTQTTTTMLYADIISNSKEAFIKRRHASDMSGYATTARILSLDTPEF